MFDDFTDYILFNFSLILSFISSLLNTSQYFFQNLRCCNVVVTVQNLLAKGFLLCRQ